MSKKEEADKKVKEYAEQFGAVIAVNEKGGISVDREAYKGIIGDEEYKRLQAANETQLQIDRGIAQAATKVGYAHIQNNSDVNSVSASINQYEGRSLAGTINRSTRVPPRDGVPESSIPGGSRWAVKVSVKGGGFKKEMDDLAKAFFAK